MIFGVCASKLSIFCDTFTKSWKPIKVLGVAIFEALSLWKSSKIWLLLCTFDIYEAFQIILSTFILFLTQSIDNFWKNELHRSIVRPKLASVVLREVCLKFEVWCIWMHNFDFFENLKILQNFIHFHKHEFRWYDAPMGLIFS